MTGVIQFPPLKFDALVFTHSRHSDCFMFTKVVTDSESFNYTTGSHEGCVSTMSEQWRFSFLSVIMLQVWWVIVEKFALRGCRFFVTLMYIIVRIENWSFAQAVAFKLESILGIRNKSKSSETELTASIQKKIIKNTQSVCFYWNLCVKTAEY